MKQRAGFFLGLAVFLSGALFAAHGQEAHAVEIGFVVPPVPRAPVRSTHGIPTVKVALDFGFAVLLGNFALDPQAPVTLVSPSWLRSQGVLAQFFTDRRAKPLSWAYWVRPTSRPRAPRAGRPILKQGRSQPLFVFQVKVGGVPLELKGLAPVETVLRTDRDGDALCCEGLLGRDFFEQFRVELKPGAQPVALLEDPTVAIEEAIQTGKTPGNWEPIASPSPLPAWDFQTRWIWDLPQGRWWHERVGPAP